MKTNLRAVIAGVADTAVGRLPGASVMGLHAEAARCALADAGLEPGDIDGVLCTYSMVEPHLMLASVFCEYFGIQPSYSSAIQAGGASACLMVAQAAALVHAGICRHVMIVSADTRLSGRQQTALGEIGHAQFERPFGMSVPSAYALVARRYMHEYGATGEHLAAIAVTQREHARRHPKAQMKDALTIADVCNSRPIATPLRLLDCCIISDGGAAIIVSASDASRDGSGRCISILGTGQCTTHEHIVFSPSLTEFGCKESARQAFQRAGITPSDIDVAEIYDSFTITLLIELESIGFFERGEAGPAALAGELNLGGILPCNTHGGLLSYAHSGSAGGFFHIVEAVRQLRGEAGLRQVKNAELAYVHGDGGILSAHSSLVLGMA